MTGLSKGGVRIFHEIKSKFPPYENRVEWATLHC
jgi:hypothetical protein